MSAWSKLRTGGGRRSIVAAGAEGIDIVALMGLDRSKKAAEQPKQTEGQDLGRCTVVEYTGWNSQDTVPFPSQYGKDTDVKLVLKQALRDAKKLENKKFRRLCSSKRFAQLLQDMYWFIFLDEFSLEDGERYVAQLRLSLRGSAGSEKGQEKAKRLARQTSGTGRRRDVGPELSPNSRRNPHPTHLAPVSVRTNNARILAESAHQGVKRSPKRRRPAPPRPVTPRTQPAGAVTSRGLASVLRRSCHSRGRSAQSSRSGLSGLSTDTRGSGDLTDSLASPRAARSRNRSHRSSLSASCRSGGRSGLGGSDSDNDPSSESSEWSASDDSSVRNSGRARRAEQSRLANVEIESEKDRIFTRMSRLYVGLFRLVSPIDKDAVLVDLPDVVTHVLRTVFDRTLPYFKQLMQEEFRQNIARRVSYWITGVERSTVRQWKQKHRSRRRRRRRSDGTESPRARSSPAKSTGTRRPPTQPPPRVVLQPRPPPPGTGSRARPATVNHPMKQRRPQQLEPAVPETARPRTGAPDPLSMTALMQTRSPFTAGSAPAFLTPEEARTGQQTVRTVARGGPTPAQPPKRRQSPTGQSPPLSGFGSGSRGGPSSPRFPAVSSAHVANGSPDGTDRGSDALRTALLTPGGPAVFDPQAVGFNQIRSVTMVTAAFQEKGQTELREQLDELRRDFARIADGRPRSKEPPSTGDRDGPETGLPGELVGNRSHSVSASPPPPPPPPPPTSAPPPSGLPGLAAKKPTNPRDRKKGGNPRKGANALMLRFTDEPGLYRVGEPDTVAVFTAVGSALKVGVLRPGFVDVLEVRTEGSRKTWGRVREPLIGWILLADWDAGERYADPARGSGLHWYESGCRRVQNVSQHWRKAHFTLTTLSPLLHRFMRDAGALRDPFRDFDMAWACA